MMKLNAIKGYRNNLKGAVSACDNGAEVTLDLTTARKLLEALDFLTASLDTAKEQQDRLMTERYAHYQRAEKAEAERDQALKVLDREKKDHRDFRNKMGGKIRHLNDRYAEALARVGAAARQMRSQAVQVCKQHMTDPADEALANIWIENIRALPIDFDAYKALDRLLTNAEQHGYANAMNAEQKDTIRELEMPGSFISTWHKVTEWCEAEGETVTAQTAWGEVKQVILAMLNDGDRG